jgi:hypothetical protein
VVFAAGMTLPEPVRAQTVARGDLDQEFAASPAVAFLLFTGEDP